jgi:hypothetical protein
MLTKYCEDPGKMGIDDFFKEVLEFLQRFDRAQVRGTHPTTLAVICRATQQGTRIRAARL